MTLHVAMTVDLEPDCPPFLSGFRGVEHGLPILLDVLERRGIPATFFTTGEVASRFPDAVTRIVSAGHELGCHGMTHRSFDELDEAAARDEIEQSTRLLRTFASVTSFRAPYLRFPPGYVPILESNGFLLDSSHARYKLAFHRDRTRSSLRRIPASVTSSVLRAPRILRRPYLRALSDPVVLFVHPWEFVDLRQERIRYDCRFRTGVTAAKLVGEVLDGFARRGAAFVTMRDLPQASVGPEHAG